MASNLIDKLEQKGVGGWAGLDSRVVRGADWSGGNADGLVGGTGEGTVVRCDGKNGVVAVKWDNGNYGLYKMGAGGKYDLKIAQPVAGEGMDKLGENENITESDSEDEYETDSEDDEDHNPTKARMFSTGQKCEVCGSIWTETVREGGRVVIRCIKHRGGGMGKLNM